MLLQATTEQLFREKFKQAPTHFFQAPGRVNLIGEHTDYNDGFVLPCAINYQTVIAAAARSDKRIVVTSANFEGQMSEFDLTAPIEHDAAAPWSDYVRGVAWTLQQRGYELQGANLALMGNVPQGAGLSSSASLEVAVGTTLSYLSGLPLDGKTVALVGQQAENQFVGVNCGIMDQFISALGRPNHALLIDCRSLDYRAVPLPAHMAVIIVNSNVKRGLVDSEYNTRRQQCEAAAAYFEVKALRDVSLEMFNERAHGLDPLIAKRAKHIITENDRTEAATVALRTGDMQQMGQLMSESHVSMRDDFAITVPQIDALVEIMAQVIGTAGGARMTGGGFGGCTVALAPLDMVPAVTTAVEQRYPAITGLQPTIYVCQAMAGAGLME